MADKICDICLEKDNCPYLFNRLLCKKEGGETYYEHVAANVVLNAFNDGSVELCYYKNGFSCELERGHVPPMERARKFIRDALTGELYCKEQSDFDVMAMSRSIKNADKRSKDMMYGYALSNEWTYWVTLTVDPKHYETFKYDTVREYFTKFQRFLKDRNKNVSILAVPERHESGALHFHTLIGTSDGGILQNISLVPAAAPENFKGSVSFVVKSGFLFDRHTGSPVFHLEDWKYGYSTAVIIPSSEDEVSNRRRITNYLTKYIIKSGNVDYCAKRFYRTRNLKFKEKIILRLSDKDITKLIKKYGFEYAVNKDGTSKNTKTMAVFLLKPNLGETGNYSQKTTLTFDKDKLDELYKRSLTAEKERRKREREGDL